MPEADLDASTGHNSTEEVFLSVADRSPIRTGALNGNAKPGPVTEIRKSREDRERKTFQLLSYLVISVLICCLPADLYHFMAATWPDQASNTFYHIATFLTFLHCILNPILYHAGLEDMKKAVHGIFADSNGSGKQKLLGTSPPDSVPPRPLIVQ